MLFIFSSESYLPIWAPLYLKIMIFYYKTLLKLMIFNVKKIKKQCKSTVVIF